MHPTSPEHRAYLDEGYEPLKHDIMCGRGADIYCHPGNMAFRNVINHNLHRYWATRSKLEKSQVVVEILHVLRSEPVKFIRFDKHKQRWYTLGDEDAKRKIGQSIRDITHQLEPRTCNVNAIGHTMKFFGRKMIKPKHCSPVSDLASDVLEKVEVFNFNQIHGRTSGHCSDNVSSTHFSSDCSTLGSSDDWFTIGGLSTDDSDFIGSIDDIF
jgi:hypothetical protein